MVNKQEITKVLTELDWSAKIEQLKTEQPHVYRQLAQFGSSFDELTEGKSSKETWSVMIGVFALEIAQNVRS